MSVVADSVLVTGGTGTLGRAVVERLPAAGREPIVLSRRPAPPDSMRAPYGRKVGDLLTREGIDEAVAQSGTIIHCASSAGKRDVAEARNLIDAARGAGTSHLVYISIVGVDQVSFGYYLAKLAVEHLLEHSGLPYTILRATQFHDLVLRLFTGQRRAPALIVPAAMNVQPIDAGEVAERLVELAVGSPAGRAADMGGPEVREVADFARSYLHAAGSRRRVAPVLLPGRIAKEFREGGHLAPGHAVGRRTFEDFLADRFAPGSSPAG